MPIDDPQTARSKMILIKRLVYIAFLLALALLPAATPASAEGNEQSIMLGGRHVVYWAPPEGRGPQPLLIFSHGFLGCATQSRFLMQYLADHGYWVFAPDHADALCGDRDAPQSPPQKNALALGPSFGAAERWNDTSYAYRRDDIVAVLAALRSDFAQSNRIDFTRIGLMGHSLGGYTVMAMGGAWPSWKMPGVKAVLALSPYSRPFNLSRSAGGIAVPVMLQGGTHDLAITPGLKDKDGTYAAVHAPKYFVEFDGAGHFAWTDMVTQFQPSIDAYSLAFFDHYVKGRAASPDLTRRHQDVAEFAYDSELGRVLPPKTPDLGERLRNLIGRSNDPQ